MDRVTSASRRSGAVPCMARREASTLTLLLPERAAQIISSGTRSTKGPAPTTPTPNISRLLSTVARSFRFAVAAILALSIAFASLEAAFPEVHDGDAPVLVAKAGTPPSSAQQGTVVNDGQADHESSEQTGGYAIHFDHCSHSHCLSPARHLRGLAISSVAHQAIQTGSDSLVGISLEPNSRPPIA